SSFAVRQRPSWRLGCGRSWPATSPNYSAAYYNLGNAFKKKGALDQAIAAYRDAIRFQPDFMEAHNNLGSALYRKGMLDEAIRAFQEALRLKPGYAPAYISLGALLCDGKHDYEGAIAAFKEAIRLKPGYAEAHFNLGVAFGGKGALDDAIAA